MHLSFLSDGFLSDTLQDAAIPTFEPIRRDASLHLQGLMRGVAFLFVLSVPLALATIPTWLHPEVAATGTVFGSSEIAPTLDRR